MKGAFLAAVFCMCWPGLLAAAPTHENEPLIMENADQMEGYRTLGEYVLTGHVRFRHGQLHFSTEKAVWQREQNKVTCESGMKITHRGSLLTADRGSYDKAKNQAMAEGKVFFRDSSGTMEGQGGRLNYDRIRQVAELSEHPIVRRLYPAVKGDSTKKAKGPDTLTIRGLILRSNDSTHMAEANGEVVIQRQDLRVTCGRAEYRQRGDSLYLYQDPKVQVEASDVKGDSMRLALDGESLRGLFVKGKAEAVSQEKATDSSAARHSKLQGDTLFFGFRQGAIDSVQVFRRALSSSFELNKPDYVNRISGDYMVLRFREKQVHDAEVFGKAKSTYYHFEKEALKGKNSATGDTIALAFKSGKVDEIMIRGSAQGTYEGREQLRAKPDSAKAGKGKT